ncbi:hypothetical protein ACFQWB_04440 [Paenibacillus thermoaerophilus]|uniref:Uncharacterized protein n=1 Tax=Paenibacillus thermoaerophilus TaxID=1215385 RepID=A0ABW2V115_9BACL|nr:hypothetical protein [Paenibacillus thermoaerophilus]TMV17463.1 hypothetical protein FE781_06965 [Paenibacillus thermoaerophilus]
MDTQRPCRGCGPEWPLTEADVARMLGKLGSRVACVPDEVYRRRLAACGDCSSLLHGHTCAHCGCIVAVRAKLADRGCPHPASSRWN